MANSKSSNELKSDLFNVERIIKPNGEIVFLVVTTTPVGPQRSFCGNFEDFCDFIAK